MVTVKAAFLPMPYLMPYWMPQFIPNNLSPLKPGLYLSLMLTAGNSLGLNAIAQPLSFPNGAIPNNGLTGELIDPLSPNLSPPLELGPTEFEENTTVDLNINPNQNPDLNPINDQSSEESLPNEFSSAETLNVKTIRILGSTVLHPQIKSQVIRANFSHLTDADISITTDAAGQAVISFPVETLTLVDLSELTSDLTQLYFDEGYVTTGAFLSPQRIAQQEVAIQVVEGEIADENLMIGAADPSTPDGLGIQELRYLSKRYIHQRLAPGLQVPINQTSLQEALELLQLDPLITNVNARLSPTHRSGYNSLEVIVEEADPWFMGLVTANDRSPAIGEWSTTTYVDRTSLITAGDRLNGQYVLTPGLDNYDLGYRLPLNPRGGTLSFRYSNSESLIVEQDFRALDIRSVSDTLSFSLDQPLHKTPNTEFSLGFGLDLRKSQTFLLNDIPFSFSQGPDNGRSKVTVVRFSQAWSHRDRRSIIAARSQLNFGLDAFDATVNDTGTDGTFFSWVGQGQWVQQLSPAAILLSRLNFQLSPDSLLSLEQFNLGGIGTVRGYRQNQLVADNGIVVGIEARLKATNRLNIIPFFELGTAWNNNDPNPTPATIASMGLGLQWNVWNFVNLKLDYGIPLMGTGKEGNSLQEDGIHLSIGLTR
ncbi:MAG: ShlB/FhaC/HecB family hemolysin secretion/activation protein [Synechococcaceae cyanobacterium RL_1_2]|nr:ShlB/FhaC/HecB family hemolysin secretion/activation protein [Synechococcaceae cyanobacterium RL_1_2]